MATLKQIDANRRNALHSTGPRTEAGKQASSRNAFKSGIFADAETIPGEDPAALAQLAAEHHARFSPQTPEARDLVDSLIRHAWLLRRLARAEAAILRCNDGSALASTRFALELKRFDILQRRVNAAERNYHRTLKALQTLPAEPAEQIYENEPNFPDPPTESDAYQDPADPTLLTPVQSLLSPRSSASSLRELRVEDTPPNPADAPGYPNPLEPLPL